LLKPFEDLGNRVAREWAQAVHSEDKFAEIATTALLESGVLTKMEPHEIVSWLVKSQQIPRQSDKDFGQPPINVYVGEGFFIQALFWVDGTTSIHEHGFVGAFGVLCGSSVESTYSFTTEKVVSERLVVGHTRFLSSELLGRGDVQPIHSADKLIHSLFHLDRPSVSIVVRTPIINNMRPQYYYAKPHLALNNDDLPPVVSIQFKMLQSLWTFDKSLFWKTAQDLIGNCEPFTFYQVISMVFSVSKADTESWSRFLAVAGDRDQWLTDHILRCLHEDQRREKLVSLRTSIHDPVHRFFLALLLNVPSRDELYKLIQKRFPDENPSDLVVRWLGEIFKEKQAGIQLTPSWLCLVDHILKDPEFDHSKEKLRDLFHFNQESDEKKIRNAWSYLQSVDILKPLMNASGSAN
jgi:hypothetical protein